ncbi:hypothetical protein SARC_12990, partial [Sphaeroforma arctica JP610]
HAGRIQKGNVVDLLSSATLFISLYRRGKLGKFCVDRLPSASAIEEAPITPTVGAADSVVGLDGRVTDGTCASAEGTGTRNAV